MNYTNIGTRPNPDLPPARFGEIVRGINRWANIYLVACNTINSGFASELKRFMRVKICYLHVINGEFVARDVSKGMRGAAYFTFSFGSCGGIQAITLLDEPEEAP